MCPSNVGLKLTNEVLKDINLNLPEIHNIHNIEVWLTFFSIELLVQKSNYLHVDIATPNLYVNIKNTIPPDYIKIYLIPDPYPVEGPVSSVSVSPAFFVQSKSSSADCCQNPQRKSVGLNSPSSSMSHTGGKLPGFTIEALNVMEQLNT